MKIIDFDLSLRIPFTDSFNEGCITDVSGGSQRISMKAMLKRMSSLCNGLISVSQSSSRTWIFDVR